MLFYYTPPKPSEPSEGMNTIELEQACVCVCVCARARPYVCTFGLCVFVCRYIFVCSSVCVVHVTCVCM